MARPDPHSVFDDAQPRVVQLDWRVRIDFATRTLDAQARMSLEGEGDTRDLDTRDLTVLEVDDGDGGRLEHQLGPPHPFLGRRLRISGVGRTVRIAYRTAPTAPALQWFDRSVYSQCQPILARSLVPLPDSPSARLRVRAEVTAPRAVTVLMGGAFVERRVDGDYATTIYEMVEPLAPSLLALAVGDFAARELSPRTRVWATPAVLDSAAAELAGVEGILLAAERLLGPYPGRRADLWIGPPSFPYGGMENPYLTFLSPSLLTGDGTLLNVVIHELAHAWFGHRVGAASAEHLWLNEGLAVYVERRLIEAFEGAAAATVHAAQGRRDLERALAAFVARPELTRLRPPLEGIDPDEGLSIVPYEKGYLFARALEARLGREPFDALLRRYLDRFAGHAVTGAAFGGLVAEAAPDFPCDEWLNQSGLPADAPAAPRLADCLSSSDARAAEPPPRTEAAHWSPWQWRLYLDGLPRPSPLCATLDEWFNLSSRRNPELRAAWLALAIESDHPPALAAVDAALDPQHPDGAGRIKFLRPLYLALARNPRTRPGLPVLWRRFRDGYHPVARQQLDRLLRELGIATQEVNALSLRRRPV